MIRGKSVTPELTPTRCATGGGDSRVFQRLQIGRSGHRARPGQGPQPARCALSRPCQPTLSVVPQLVIDAGSCCTSNLKPHLPNVA